MPKADVMCVSYLTLNLVYRHNAASRHQNNLTFGDILCH